MSGRSARVAQGHPPGGDGAGIRVGVGVSWSVSRWLGGLRTAPRARRRPRPPQARPGTAPGTRISRRIRGHPSRLRSRRRPSRGPSCRRWCRPSRGRPRRVLSSPPLSSATVSSEPWPEDCDAGPGVVVDPVRGRSPPWSSPGSSSVAPGRAVAAVVVARLGLRGAGCRVELSVALDEDSLVGERTGQPAGRRRRCRGGRRWPERPRRSRPTRAMRSVRMVCPFEGFSVSEGSDGEGESGRAGPGARGAHLRVPWPAAAAADEGAACAAHGVLRGGGRPGVPAGAVTPCVPRMDSRYRPLVVVPSPPRARRIRSTGGNTHGRAHPRRACCLLSTCLSALRPAGPGRRWRGSRRARTARARAPGPRRSW